MSEGTKYPREWIRTTPERILSSLPPASGLHRVYIFVMIHHVNAASPPTANAAAMAMNVQLAALSLSLVFMT